MRWLLRVLFTGWCKGRLGRRDFLLSHLALWAVILPTLAGMQLIVLQLQSQPDALPQAWQLAALLAGAVVLLGVLPAMLNTLAKRLRDMGLPGWPGTFVILLLTSPLMLQLIGKVPFIALNVVLSALLLLKESHTPRGAQHVAANA